MTNLPPSFGFANKPPSYIDPLVLRQDRRAQDTQNIPPPIVVASTTSQQLNKSSASSSFPIDFLIQRNNNTPQPNVAVSTTPQTPSQPFPGISATFSQPLPLPQYQDQQQQQLQQHRKKRSAKEEESIRKSSRPKKNKRVDEEFIADFDEKPRPRGRKVGWMEDFELEEEDYEFEQSTTASRRGGRTPASNGSGSIGRTPDVVIGTSKHGRNIKRSRRDFSDDEIEETSFPLPTNPPPQHRNHSSSATGKVKLCWLKSQLLDPHRGIQNLRFVLPLKIPTCKAHNDKVENAIRDAATNNKIVMNEGNGVKDSVCGICGGISGSNELVTCCERNCSFAFCRVCVNSLQVSADFDGIHYAFDDLARNNGNWSCWVCLAARNLKKFRERPYVLGDLVCISFFCDPLFTILVD